MKKSKFSEEQMTCALREVEAGRRHQPDQSTGSIESVGCGLQPFIINDLELVSLTLASWNRIREWLRRVDALRRSA